MNATEDNSPDDSRDAPIVRFVRKKRSAARDSEDVFFAVEKKAGSPQLVKSPLRATAIHVMNRPARFPPAWPEEMRAETAAAFLDFSTTREMCKAIQRGEAAPPTSFRTSAGKIEAVWLAVAVKRFVASRHQFEGE
jgi:hypothetical protein